MSGIEKGINVIKRVVVAGLVVLGLKFIILPAYFRLNPTVYKDYRVKADYKEPGSNTMGYMLHELPIGGCWNVCNGNKIVLDCESYNPKYERCEFSCEGFLYNRCSGTMSTLMYIFTR